MKAWRLNDFGLDNRRLEEMPTQTPSAGGLVVRVSAVSPNFRDKAILDGFYEPVYTRLEEDTATAGPSSSTDEQASTVRQDRHRRTVIK